MQKLLDLGIDAETSLDFAIAIRTSNMTSACMTIVAVASTVAYVVGAKMPLLGVLNLFLGLLYTGCLLLSAAGLFRAARWVFLATASMHYAQFSLAFGHGGGATFWIAGLIAYPVGAFARIERRQVMSTYVILAVVFVATEVATRAHGPLVLEPLAVEQAYYFTVLALSGVVGLVLSHYKNSSVVARVNLDAARVRIAELLDNMLPSSIAVRLQHGERVIADSHGEASVLFADLTGFSVLTRRLSPTHLVEVLNRIFSRFDEAAGRCGIEKIKTIGDCYMAATGVLDDRAGFSGADAMAKFALEMLTIVDVVSRELGLPLGVRVGISTGAVVSGVIGKRRFNFDVWGDTVNLASQMESTSPVGKIQISEATFWRLRDRYSVEPRGEIEVKSGQRVSTYLLTGDTPSVHP